LFRHTARFLLEADLEIIHGMWSIFRRVA
jgi:hypothetical protein